MASYYVSCNFHIFTSFLISVILPYAACKSFPDWLITKIDNPTKFVKLPGPGNYRLTNGLISRDFITNPDFATIDYYSYEHDASILRALDPEGQLSLDGTLYNIGGVLNDSPRAYLNRSDLKLREDPLAFHFVRFDLMEPFAPFPYQPKRGAPSDVVWPPKGLRVDILFNAPFSAPSAHQYVQVKVHYEMYDGIPLLSKWISVDLLSNAPRDVSLMMFSVEYLSVNQQWASHTENNHQWEPDSSSGLGWLYVETDQPHGTNSVWGADPSQPSMPGSFERSVNCTYAPVPRLMIGGGFESFKVHEFVIGSNDPERVALAKLRMLRLLAPYTQENPIFFHMTNMSSVAIRAVIDEMAEVGFEMMIYSFGAGFDIESTDPAYIADIAAEIAYANSKGIEVGGYDLIAWSRRTRTEWMEVDASGHTTDSACFASGWYDNLMNALLTFVSKTGLTMLETDGPYAGFPCYSTNHSHHRNVEDSVHMQQQLQGKFFQTFQTIGVYTNQPDYYFYQGGSKTKFNYDEQEFSLPRWQDISIGRQTIYDGSYLLSPPAGWMFVPLVHYEGGGDEAIFEPLSAHLMEYEWALAQYLGAGVAACYRGYRLYDSDLTKAIVAKWVGFYKKYRDILISDLVHVRRPDMQGIDSFMHVNPFIKNRALAMVFNPTDRRIVTTLTLPLYYAGLNVTALIAEQEGPFKQYNVERDYSVDINVDIDPLSITWFIVRDD